MSIPAHAPVTPIAAGRNSDQILAGLIERKTTLAADAEYIAGEIAAIDGQIIELLGSVGVHDVAGTKVEIREYSRTDLKWIETEYPADQYPQLYKTTTAVDGDAVKREFAPAVLAQHKVTGKRSVVIK